MELDPIKMALGRIETSLQRLEKAVAVGGQTAPPPRNGTLEAEVLAVIGELDRIIAESEHG